MEFQDFYKSFSWQVKSCILDDFDIWIQVFAFNVKMCQQADCSTLRTNFMFSDSVKKNEVAKNMKEKNKNFQNSVSKNQIWKCYISQLG